MYLRSKVHGGDPISVGKVHIWWDAMLQHQLHNALVPSMDGLGKAAAPIHLEKGAGES